jgi:hypothetical protein
MLAVAVAIPALQSLVATQPALADPQHSNHCKSGYTYPKLKSAGCVCGLYTYTYAVYCKICLDLCYTYNEYDGGC